MILMKENVWNLEGEGGWNREGEIGEKWEESKLEGERKMFRLTEDLNGNGGNDI